MRQLLFVALLALSIANPGTLEEERNKPIEIRKCHGWFKTVGKPINRAKITTTAEFAMIKNKMPGFIKWVDTSAKKYSKKDVEILKTGGDPTMKLEAVQLNNCFW